MRVCVCVCVGGGGGVDDDSYIFRCFLIGQQDPAQASAVELETEEQKMVISAPAPAELPADDDLGKN